MSLRNKQCKHYNKMRLQAPPDKQQWAGGGARGGGASPVRGTGKKSCTGARIGTFGSVPALGDDLRIKLKYGGDTNVFVGEF